MRAATIVRLIYAGMILACGLMWTQAKASPALMTYDTSASLLFKQITINSCTALTQAQKAAINGDIVRAKSNGLWTGYDLVFAPGIFSDACGGLINWKNPSSSATVTGTAPFTSFRGVSTNGTDGYWDSGVANNALVQCTQNNCRLSTWIQSFGAATSCRAIGNFSEGTASNIRTSLTPGFTPNAPSARVMTGTTASAVVLPPSAGQLYSADRTVSSSVDFYTDGSALATGISSTSAAPRAATVTFLATNTGNFANTGCVFALFTVGRAFTSGEEALAPGTWSPGFTWAATQ